MTPTSNSDQTTQNYEIDPSRPGSTTQTRGMTTNAELIDQALRHGPEIDARGGQPVTNGTAPKCTLDGCDLPMYPGHDFCTQEHFDRYHGVVYPYNGAGRVDLLLPAYHRPGSTTWNGNTNSIDSVTWTIRHAADGTADGRGDGTATNDAEPWTIGGNAIAAPSDRITDQADGTNRH